MLPKAINDKIAIENNVTINKLSQFEDHIKIYHHTSVLSSRIGRGTYIGWNAIVNNATIGRYCSIAPFTEIIYGRHPTNQFVSTHPAFFSTIKQAGFSFVEKSKFDEFKHADTQNKKSVIIGNDVWIGYGAKIMEGVTIGDGAIIGAMSVVTKDIAPYSINVGIPSKIIRSRFNDETIRKLLKTKWWNKDFHWIKSNANLFSDIENLIMELENEK